MSGEAVFGTFCVAWLIIGGMLLAIQLFSRLRGIERLRQLQSDETAALAQIEAEIKTFDAEANEAELRARTLRRMIRMWEQRLEASSAVQIATVTIPLATRMAPDPKLHAGPRFE